MPWSQENWKTVAMCADAAVCSYQDADFNANATDLLHIATVEAVERSDRWSGCFHRAVLLRRGSDLVVAFRGTVGGASWRSEWATNLHLSFAWAGGAAHRGFVRAVDRLWDELSRRIDSEEAFSRLFVTGHSKGAGMACVAAERLVRRGTQGVHLVTFSEPPVYNTFANRQVWQTIKEKGLEDYRRLIHKVDVLPMLTMFFPNHSDVAVFGRDNKVEYRRADPLTIVWNAAREGFAGMDPLPLKTKHGAGGYRELSYRCAAIAELRP